MNICHVVYSHYPFDPRVRKEVGALAALGYDIDVIAVQDQGEQREEGLGRLHVYRLPIAIIRGEKLRYAYQYGLFFLCSAALLFRLFLVRRYAVIHVHSLPDFQVFCTFLERLLGARVILDLHEAMPEIVQARFHLSSHHPLVALSRAAERLSAQYADRIVVPTDQRQRLLTRRGVESTKIAVVMNSPDDASIAGPPSDELRSQLGLDGKRVVVHAGGVNPERDLEVLIRAAGQLSAQYPMSLLLYGKGDPGYIDRLQTVAAEYSRLDFRFGGWVPQSLAFQLVLLSEVGVVTYERNPLTELAAPHKILEYAAAGKPLVFADLNGLREVWDSAALFYRPGDAVDLASRIEQLFGDVGLRTRLSGKARSLAERFDWRHSRKALQETYEALTIGVG